MRSSKEIDVFRQKLLRWYKRHARDLPWRRTRDPYAILVAEIMLQQTQVSAVVPFYERWLTRFPTFASLAAASEAEVLHAWQGLGYYSRARNLHTTAKIVVSQFGGVLPRDPGEIRKLPGLGRYTANAVATFAFNRSVPIVEANISRVIARLFNITQPVDSSAGRERLWRGAESLLPKRNAATFNSALMELGAVVCVKTPRCGLCPVKTFCRATKPESLPIKRARPKTVCLTESHAFVRRGNQLLLEKCSNRWRGMWMLPALSAVPKRERAIYSSIFPFTHHRVSLFVFKSQARTDSAELRWTPLHQLDHTPIPSPHRRALNSLIAKPSAV